MAGMVQCPTCRKRGRSGTIVFVEAKCPVCLEKVKPFVALPCGHPLSITDFQELGGKLPTDNAPNGVASAAATRAGRDKLEP